MNSAHALCYPLIFSSQVVCSRRSRWLVVPTVSGVFRPPYQQVREKDFMWGIIISVCLIPCFIYDRAKKQPATFQKLVLIMFVCYGLNFYVLTDGQFITFPSKLFSLYQLMRTSKCAGGTAALQWLKGVEVWVWPPGMAFFTPSEGTMLLPRLFHLD